MDDLVAKSDDFAVLNASNCKLTSVPSVVEVLLCLKALVISHNALTQLDHVRNLPDLNTIGTSLCSSRECASDEFCLQSSRTTP